MESFPAGVGDLGFREEGVEEVVEGLGDGGGVVELLGVEFRHFGEAEEGFGAPAADGYCVYGRISFWFSWFKMMP